MNKFWPERAQPKGFSIEKLAKNYRQKLTNSSINQIELNLKNNIEDDSSSLNNNLDLSNNDNIDHWANRYFEEYRRAA